jgi:hypothetical protein
MQFFMSWDKKEFREIGLVTRCNKSSSLVVSADRSCNALREGKKGEHNHAS